MASTKGTPQAPVEIVAERTACAKVFDLGNGQRRASISITPQHAPDDPVAWRNGQRCGWLDIDTSVKAKGNGKLAPGACWYGCEIPQDAVGYDYTSILTGGTVSIRLLEIDGNPVGAIHPGPTVEADGVWWRNVATQLDFRLDIRPGAVELFKRLRGNQAPRSFLWQVTESADRSIPLRHQTAGHDNADLNDHSRDGLGVGRIRRRIEMAAAVLGPETTNPDGSVTYTVTERWTGNTIALDLNRVPSLDSAVSYPVLIDTVVNEVIAANGDDGDQIDTAGTWENSYGSTGKHIIYDPSSNTVAHYPGWRFTTVAIPQAATINSATLTLTLSNSSSGTGATATVYGWATDNASAWANGAGPVQAAKTTASAAFGTWGGGVSGSRAITVTSIVQEIVNRAGWASNNAMSLFAAYTPNNNSSFTYINDLAGGSTGIAKLDVDYTAAGGGTTVSVPAGSLTLSGKVPTVIATANQTVAVPAGSLALTGLAPTVLTPVTVAVPAGSLSLTTQTPIVTATANQNIAVPAGSLTLTAQTPTVVTSGSQVVDVPAGSLTLTGYAPTVIATANVTVSVPTGNLVLTANAPLVQTPILVAVPTGQLALSAQTPLVVATTNVVIDVPSGALTLSPLAPEVLGEVVPSAERFSGGYTWWLAWEREQERRRRKRKRQQELEDEARALQDRIDRDIALLLRQQEAESAREAELARLKRLVRRYSHQELELSDRAKVAYVRALTQQNFSALEALERELAQQIEEEDHAVLMLLLS